MAIIVVIIVTVVNVQLVIIIQIIITTMLGRKTPLVTFVVKKATLNQTVVLTKLNYQTNLMVEPTASLQGSEVN